MGLPSSVRDLTFNICRKTIDKMVLVTNESLFGDPEIWDASVIPEPAGQWGFAAVNGKILESKKDPAKNCCTLRGANMFWQVLDFIQSAVDAIAGNIWWFHLAKKAVCWAA